MSSTGWIRATLALSLLGGALLPASAQDPSDPFDPINKALSRKTQALLEVIDFDVNLSPTKAKRGETVRVTLKGTPAKGYHAYPLTKITNEQVPTEVEITYGGIEGLKPLWPIYESDPQLALSLESRPGTKEKKIVFELGKPFTWSQDLLIEPDAVPGKYPLMVTIANLMVCNKGSCVGPASFRPLFVPLEISADPAATPNAEIAKRPQAAPAPQVITPTADEIAALKAHEKSTPAVGIKPPDGKPDTVDANNLWSFLWFASLSAFLMLLTPCVFPMIPITVNFFIKQSEKEHHNPLLMASVYSGTIIVLLTVIMLVLGSVIISIANNEWFNVGLGLVLIFFALSLFGMYEIELPHFLARYTSAREGQGGTLGTIFMAMTFTITSFTCTGPFLGLMLGSVAGVKPPMVNLVLGALVYSTTFAAPFFVLALFPSFLKKLPKSGSWLNSVKVTMGFLELGAALKFLSNADLAFFPGNPQVFNYDTVLAAWIALSVGCSLYLLGLFRLPHDDKVESIGVLRMMIAVGFLGLAIYLAPAMFGVHPAGFLGDNAVAFLPVRTGHEADSGGGPGGKSAPGSQGHKDWHMNYEDAWKDAVDNNKLIFIDFTGTNCTNCRYNEQSVFPLPQVQDELKKFVKVSLYTDSVPNKKLTFAESKAQAKRNELWRDTIGDPSNPYYVVIAPARDAALENGLPKGAILGRSKGAIFDVGGFVNVLQAAQSKQTAQLRTDFGDPR